MPSSYELKLLPHISSLQPLDRSNYKRWANRILIYFEQLKINYLLFKDPPKSEIIDVNPVTPASGVSSIVVTPLPSKDKGKEQDDSDDMVQKYKKDNKLAKNMPLSWMVDFIFDLYYA